MLLQVLSVQCNSFEESPTLKESSVLWFDHCLEAVDQEECRERPQLWHSRRASPSIRLSYVLAGFFPLKLDDLSTFRRVLSCKSQPNHCLCQLLSEAWREPDLQAPSLPYISCLTQLVPQPVLSVLDHSLRCLWRVWMPSFGIRNEASEL